MYIICISYWCTYMYMYLCFMHCTKFSAGGKTRHVLCAAKGSIISVTTHGKLHVLTAAQITADYCFKNLAIQHLQILFYSQPREMHKTPTWTLVGTYLV